MVIRDIDERAMELLIDFAYTSQVTVQAMGVHSHEGHLFCNVLKPKAPSPVPY